MNKTPIYKNSGTYAQEHDELKKYFASHNANVVCKEVIEQAIAGHYHDNRLSRDAAKEVIAQFGIGHTMYVLAAGGGDFPSHLQRGIYEMAKDAGKLAEYRMSRRVNGLCQWEIDEAVTVGWDGLWDAAQNILTSLAKLQ